MLVKSIKSIVITFSHKLITKALEIKKSHRADLERRRGLFFLIAWVIILLLGVAAWQFSLLPKAKTDIETSHAPAIKDLEFLNIKKEEDRIPLISLHQKKVLTQKIHLVDKTSVSKDKPEDRTTPDTLSRETDSQTAQLRDTATHIDTPIPPQTDPLKFRILQQLPQFPGGYGAMMAWIKKNLHYPEMAKAQHIQGKVVVAFIIETDGSVTSHRVTRPAHPILNEEAMRLIKQMPPWKPGIEKGKPCKTLFAIPIVFKL